MEESIAKEKEESYEIRNDWKFISIVQFVNLFKNVLCVDQISTLELENSLKYPEIESHCLNILLKLLMKKALFKPNSKIGENFEVEKFNEMLLKKINFFYKTYIRYVKKINGVSDNLRIFELIRKDVEEYNSKNSTDIFALNRDNLGEKEYEDMDIKNVMIVDFFRGLGGRNPFLKSSIQVDKMEIYLEQVEKEDEKNAKVEIADQNNQVLEGMNDDFLTFNDLSVKDKVDILFFFCNYALTFSGRAGFYHEELKKDPKESTHLNYKRIKPLGSDRELNIYYSLLCNKDCRIYKETDKGEFRLIVKNYEELSKFLNDIKISDDYNQNLINNIKDSLLNYKENDEEESKKEVNFVRKQQAFEKAKRLGTRQGSEVEKFAHSDYFLMNISDHVITRNQLNQITKTSLQPIQQTQTKTNALTEEDKKKIKIEKEKLERQKRLEKRTRLIEKKFQREVSFSSEDNNVMLTNKRNRLSKKKIKIKKRKRGNKYDTSEEEYESSVDSVEKSRNQSLELEFDSDKSELCNIEENYNIQEYPQIDNIPQENGNNDIILEGQLIYRFSNNQIELDGNWFMSQDTGTKERLSFLFQNSNEFMECSISSTEITSEENETLHDYYIKICAANVFECICINKLYIFESVLNFLSGEYAGYFMYYGKTIEDRVNLSYVLEDSLIRVTGEGTNCLGNFSVIGYMNFYRTKDYLLEKNEINSEVIKLAEFKLTKIYTAFNPNENYRVIKSYQHRRKNKGETESSF